MISAALETSFRCARLGKLALNGLNWSLIVSPRISSCADLGGGVNGEGQGG
jgi:hypothetical protein